MQTQLRMLTADSGQLTAAWCFLPLPVSQLLDMKVFVDTDSDIRLIRRLQRDVSQRGRNISGIVKQYNKFVKPAFEQYIEPTVQLADIVVPRGEWCSGTGAARNPPPRPQQPAGLT